MSEQTSDGGGGLVQPAVFFVANNADTWAETWPQRWAGDPDHLPESVRDTAATADTDGHMISAAVLRRGGSETPLAPVRAVVSHGVSPQTAAAMLRKMADLIERAPDVLSAEPGTSVRALPDGGVRRVKVTLDALRGAADQVDDATKRKLLDTLGELGPAIDDPPPEPPLGEG
ncbi:MAG: hypothetical protein AAF297_00905 [Planctomycetota bacterium]